MIRVLLVDDQALLRDGFRSILDREEDIDVVAEAGDGAEALDAAARTSPDVVLMDIRMPRMDGLTATRRLLDTPRPPRILVLTTYDTDQHLYEALRAGASGFLLKDVRAAQLLSAVRTVAAGEELYAPTVLRRIVASYVETQRPRPPSPHNQLAVLSQREREVSLLIARGMSNAEIASHLVLSEATVKTHVNRILAKLEVRDRVQVVVLAYESGLVTPAG
ncbi:response regulator transcription factor [Marmoricola sp. URHB0036]|uniref:response regulator n=1 Tax=Marmoricola sp. URHB0036 TaxID=1298863 RepID=UPI0004201EB4|nr:response regulator transcription factor [Marmoricola sp. URHB0036]